MSLLYVRLQELRDEYFNEFYSNDLYLFYVGLDKQKEYSSDELIKLLAAYSDKNKLRDTKKS